MQKLEIHQITTAQDLERALSVRRHVFIEEQHIPEAEELDEHDLESSTSSLHVLATLDGHAVGTARLLIDSGAHGDPLGARYPHIGRVAVLNKYRRR